MSAQRADLMPMLTEPRDDVWVRAQVAKLPGSAVAALQNGPIEGRACRVCVVLGPLEAGPPPARRVPGDTGDPAVDLLDYHAIDGPSTMDSSQGPPADRAECYRRCIQIYRAAGWTDAA